MAACTRQLWRVFPLSLSSSPLRNIPIRSLATARPVKKGRKEESGKAGGKDGGSKVGKDGGSKGVREGGRVRVRVGEPVDDVFLLPFYVRRLHQPEEAVRLLQTNQRLDHTPPQQGVYIDLLLDMKLEKKRRVDPFVGVVQFPFPFQKEENRVLVFTEDPVEVRVALDHGAAVVGGAELIQPILDQEVSVDFFVSVPAVLPKLALLKNLLRKKFPKTSRGSVGVDIPRMLSVFRWGHQFQVEDDCYVRTQIATLDMTSDLILANLRTLISDITARRPASMGPFIQRSILSSSCSEALWLQPSLLLPAEEPHDQDQI